MRSGLQIASLALGLVGTWLLAFGLKVRPGISRDLRKELGLDETDLIAPSDVRTRPGLFWGGLLLLTLAGTLQAVALLLPQDAERIGT